MQSCSRCAKVGCNKYTVRYAYQRWRCIMDKLPACHSCAMFGEPEPVVQKKTKEVTLDKLDFILQQIEELKAAIMGKKRNKETSK